MDIVFVNGYIWKMLKRWSLHGHMQPYSYAASTFIKIRIQKLEYVGYDPWAYEYSGLPEMLYTMCMRKEEIHMNTLDIFLSRINKTYSNKAQHTENPLLPQAVHITKIGRASCRERG